MPIKVKSNLPARDILENENIFVMTENRAMTQNIRPLKVLVLNLMPTKIVTETQILRKLSNTPLQIEVEFLQTATYRSTHTDPSHMDEFYKTFDEVKDHHFDGLIITGAPLDFVAYEDVEYWDELCTIMEWSKKHVHCTFHLCWGAFAGLYYHYGIQKRDRVPKLSGIYKHHILNKKSPLFRGFDDVGVGVVKSVDSRQFFVLYHSEYDADTLKLEYERDLAKGMDPIIPVNYFPDDDPTKEPIVNWRAAGQLLWTNWINYYVYQTTPYNINEVENE